MASNCLLAVVRDGKHPFRNVDVNLLVREVETAVGAAIIDIPIVTKGTNNLVRYCVRSWGCLF